MWSKAMLAEYNKDVPPQLQIKPSGVNEERMGIWCKKPITVGSKFGPFQGDCVLEATDDMDPNCVWEIVDLETKEFLFYIDATDPADGNWMRHINCARFFEEQNIVSEQEGIDIFYRAIKDISPGEEILTWYEKAPLRKSRGKKQRKKSTSRREPLERGAVSEVKNEPLAPQVSKTPPVPSVSPSPRKDHPHSAHLRRSKRRCLRKGHDDDDFIYGQDTEDEDEEVVVNGKVENSVDDEKDDISDDGTEDYTHTNGYKSDMENDEHFNLDSSGYFQFEMLPIHVGKGRLGRKVFRCDICLGVYRHAFSLKRHYIRNHINLYYVAKTDAMNCNISKKVYEAVSTCKPGCKPEDRESGDESVGPGDEENEQVTEEEVDMETTTNDGHADRDQHSIDTEQCGSVKRSEREVPFTGEKVKENGDNPGQDAETAAPVKTTDTESDEATDGVVSVPSVPSKHEGLAQGCADVVVGQRGSEGFSGLFRCNLCECLVNSAAQLREHLQNHPDVNSGRTLSCSQCEMKFSKKHNLMRHQAVHSGSKSHECSVCDKKFPTLSAQKRHERVHQERRYTCTLCDSSFVQGADMKKHARKVHPDQYHECGYCNRYFTTESALVDHLQGDHDGEDISSNSRQLEARREATTVNLETDRVKSMQLASTLDAKYACTICCKQFHDYANMCRHRRLAHHRYNNLLKVSKTNPGQSPIKALEYVKDEPQPNYEYYANIAKNISDNLNNHMEGKRSALGNSEMLIKWWSSSRRGRQSNGDSDTVQQTDVDINLEKYNFPSGFQLRSTKDLYRQKAEYSVLFPDNLQQIMPEPQKEEHVRADMESKSEVKNQPTDLSDENRNDSDTNRLVDDYLSMKSPPPPQTHPDMVHNAKQGKVSKSCSPANSVCSENKYEAALSIKVPEFKTCSVCKSIFRSYSLYREHMYYRHRIKVPDPNFLPLEISAQFMNSSSVSPVGSAVSFDDSTSFIGSDTSPVAATTSSTNSPNTTSPRNCFKPLNCSVSPTNCSNQQPLDLSSPKECSNNNWPTETTPQISEDNTSQDMCVDIVDLISGMKSRNVDEMLLESREEKPKVSLEDLIKPPEVVTKFVCLVCYNEFSNKEQLINHQSEDHPTIVCSHVEVEANTVVNWCRVPNPIGMLNLSVTQFSQDTDELADPEKLYCTKCGVTLPDHGSLHSHIMECGGYTYTHYVYYSYVYDRSRGVKVKTKKSKYSRHKQEKETPRKLLSNVDISVDGGNRHSSVESLDDEEERRRKRKKNYELLYNPLNHIRRREMAEIVDTQKCRGCGYNFETISLLERHIPVCSDKEKIRIIHKDDSTEDEDSDEFDPNKHMCIYCEKLFTYMGMLKKHVKELCQVRKDFIEQKEPLDEEWEADLDIKQGRKDSLSRQSSCSSLVALVENEIAEDIGESRKRKRGKRRRRGWGWNKMKRQRSGEDGVYVYSPYSLKGTFMMFDESSNSSGITGRELGDDVLNVITPIKSERLHYVSQIKADHYETGTGNTQKKNNEKSIASKISSPAPTKDSSRDVKLEEIKTSKKSETPLKTTANSKRKRSISKRKNTAAQKTTLNTKSKVSLNKKLSDKIKQKNSKHKKSKSKTSGGKLKSVAQLKKRTTVKTKPMAKKAIVDEKGSSDDSDDEDNIALCNFVSKSNKKLRMKSSQKKSATKKSPLPRNRNSKSATAKTPPKKTSKKFKPISKSERKSRTTSVKKRNVRSKSLSPKGVTTRNRYALSNSAKKSSSRVKSDKTGKSSSVTTVKRKLKM